MPGKTPEPEAPAALIVVPPFLASVNGPILGPAMLAGAARDAGFRADVLDLGALHMNENFEGLEAWAPSPFIGDHDKPAAEVKAVRRRFEASLLRFLPPPPQDAPKESIRKPVVELPYDHEDVHEAARGVAASSIGDWVRGHLWRETPPTAVCLSVMASGQVLMALTIAVVAKELWPHVPVVMGGAHATALRDEIVRDRRYGELVDWFVFGYAERTFVEMLSALSHGSKLPPECVAAGSGKVVFAFEDATVHPAFIEPRALYRWARLTLPVQITRGCAYGRCAYCTYPAVEGSFRVSASPVLPWFVDEAERHSAALSFKDSLFLPKQLREAAVEIRGRVKWSATTKLNASLRHDDYQAWADAGLATLEFGIESLSPVAQRLIEKKQPLSVFLDALDALSGTGITVVINYIVGFPTLNRSDEEAWLERLSVELSSRREQLTTLLQLQEFALERLAPMAKHPDRYGLRIGQSSPWSSRLSWSEYAGSPSLLSSEPQSDQPSWG